LCPCTSKRKEILENLRKKVEDRYNVKAVLLEIGENYNVPE